MSSLDDAVRQAAGYRKRRRVTPAAKSSLACCLKQMFAWGSMPASTVQAICQASVEDGLEHEEVIGMSNIGVSGMHQNHCRRDLLRIVIDGSVAVPDPHWFDIPFQDRKGKTDTMKHPIFLPHELLHAIATKYPDHFASLQCVSTSEFWRKLDRTDPKYLCHPIREEPHKEQKGLPLVIHGDGAVLHDETSQHSVAPVAASACTRESVMGLSVHDDGLRQRSGNSPDLSRIVAADSPFFQGFVRTRRRRIYEFV